MKITIESTPQFVTINGVLTRLWLGETESGASVLVCVHRIGLSDEATPEESLAFALELDMVPDPTSVVVTPGAPLPSLNPRNN